MWRLILQLINDKSLASSADVDDDPNDDSDDDNDDDQDDNDASIGLHFQCSSMVRIYT